CGLIRYFVTRFRAAARAEQLATAVTHALLKATTVPGARRLTDADLLRLVIDATTVQVARPDFEAITQALAARVAPGAAGDGAQPLETLQFFEPEAGLPWPPLLADRPELAAEVLQSARQNGVAFVTGSTGCGKTLVARLAARAA